MSKSRGVRNIVGLEPSVDLGPVQVVTVDEAILEITFTDDPAVLEKYVTYDNFVVLVAIIENPYVTREILTMLSSNSHYPVVAKLARGKLASAPTLEFHSVPAVEEDLIEFGEADYVDVADAIHRIAFAATSEDLDEFLTYDNEIVLLTIVNHELVTEAQLLTLTHSRCDAAALAAAQRLTEKITARVRGVVASGE